MPIPPGDARRRDLRRHRQLRKARATRRRVLLGSTASLTLVAALVLGGPVLLGQGHDEADIGAAVIELVGDRPTAGGPGRDRERTASRSGQRSATPAPAPGPSASSTSTQDDAPASAPADDAAPTATAPAAAETPTHPVDRPSTPAPEPSTTQPAEPVQPSEPAHPAPSADPTAPAADTTYADEVVALTNAARREAGLTELTVSTCATEQAVARASVLVDEGRFEHDPLDPVVKACEVGAVGENLSLGYPDAQAAVEGWLASPGHRENILRPGYTAIGVGCVEGDNGVLCAQVFLG